MVVMAIIVVDSVVCLLRLLTAPGSMKRTVGQRKRRQSPRSSSSVALHTARYYKTT